MIEPPPFFHPPGWDRGAPPPRFGRGRRIRIREEAPTLARGGFGVIERVLGHFETGETAERQPLYRVRVALADIGLAERPDRDAGTLDVEVFEAAIAPFFDYGADPRAEAERIERALAASSDLPDAAGIEAPKAEPDPSLDLEAARALARRARDDPSFAADLASDAGAAAASGIDRLIVWRSSEAERHRLVRWGATPQPRVPSEGDMPPLRLHDLAGPDGLGARMRYMVLPEQCDPQHLTPTRLAGGA